jgi:DNA (cytosine-5)-methyltransferase 1
MIDFSQFGVPQKRCRFILIGIRKEISEKQGVIARTFFDLILKNKESFLKSKNLLLNANLEDAISDLLMKHGTIQSPDTDSFKAGVYSKAQSNYQKYLRVSLNKNEIPDSHRFVNHSEEVKNRFKYILTVAKKNTSISDDLKAKYNLKKRTLVPLDGRKSSPTITTLPDDYIHYSEARILTVREYARIQSFPDDYQFKGKYTTGGKRRVLEAPRYTQIGNAIPPLFGEQSGIILKQLIS